MGRNTSKITIDSKDRDEGKTFLITEMSSEQGEEWAIRVLLALAKSDVELPVGMEDLSMATLAQMGMKALTGLQWELAKPLLEEMMECVQIIPDPKKTHVIRPLITEDIEEISTRFKLRVEVFKLHTGFLKAVAPLISRVEKATAKPAPPQPIRTSRRS